MSSRLGNVEMMRGALGETRFELMKGDITRQICDVIVNTTNSDLNKLTSDVTGEVSKAITREAGKAQLQAACRNLTIPTGEVIATDAFLLPSKRIYHVYLQHWHTSSNKNELKDALKRLVNACLEKASEEGRQSIAFPAIGSGANCWPGEVVARVMLNEVTKYFDTNPSTSLLDVCFVVFNPNVTVVKAFQDSFNDACFHRPIVSRPEFIDNMTQCNKSQAITLQPDNQLYKEVEQMIDSTDDGALKEIVKMQRLINTTLKASFEAHKARVGNTTVQQLWHGTRSECVKGIQEYGFKSDMLGYNRNTQLGKGHSFAVKAGYSMKPAFAKPDDEGNCRMFLCEVVTGKAGLGDPSLTSPPAGCHSAVDSLAAPERYVVFNDEAIYPKYLVTFK